MLLDKLSLSRCSVKLGHWKIGSYCSVLAGMIEKRVPIDKWNSFKAEKIIAFLGKATNKTVGQQVSIPVRVVNKGCGGKHELGVGFDLFDNYEMDKNNLVYEQEMLFLSMLRRRLN